MCCYCKHLIDNLLQSFNIITCKIHVGNNQFYNSLNKMGKLKQKQNLRSINKKKFQYIIFDGNYNYAVRGSGWDIGTF